MEGRGLVVLTFSEIIGVFQSEVIKNEKDYLTHKLFIRKGITALLESLLGFCQVALFLDMASTT